MDALSSELPKGFVSLSDVDSSIIVEARYFGPHNFIGKRINGYEGNKCILTNQAADALKQVQSDIKEFGYTLKVYDCYRPQRAVDQFVQWAEDLKDTKMKNEFYPEVNKKDLFKKGYIAKRSGHSRGSTVDLTIVKLSAKNQEVFSPSKSKLKDCRLSYGKRFKDNSLDMGTGYDCFDPLSHTKNPQVGSEALRNRLLLKLAMEKRGFENYSKEWWHFTLKNEPFPKTFFNFVVK